MSYIYYIIILYFYQVIMSFGWATMLDTFDAIHGLSTFCRKAHINPAAI